MSGQDVEKTSSDESKSAKSGEDVEDPQKALLEEEIKKIISDLDIKFEDSTPDEEDGMMTGKGSSTVPTTSTMQPSTESGERETAHTRAESASTVSAATTVVHHRVPPKITSSHVKSERQDWPPSPISQTPIFGYHQAPYEDYHNAGHSYNAVQEHDFYRPERDEITEQTTTSETLISTLDSTTYGHTTPSTQMPSYGQTLRRGILPTLAEENSGLLKPQPIDQNVMQMQGSNYPNHTNLAGQDPAPQYTANQAMDMSPSRMNQTAPVANQPYQTEYQSRLPDYHQPRLSEYQSQYQPEYAPAYQNHHSLPPANQHQQMREKIDRYNSTHMTYSPVKETEKPRRSLTDFLISKSRNMFRKNSDSDSGEVIPQLYKASIKNGTSPARFTFKAVTGCQPPPCCCCKCTGGTPYHGLYADRQSSCDMPCVPTEMRKECCAPCQPPCPVPSYEPPCNPCCCKDPMDQQLEKKKSSVRLKKTCPTGDCEVTALPPKDGVKTKAYYTELGCGYISQGSVPEKVDIYCFDQLNTGFFRTSDHPPPLFADIAIQRTEKYATVFWAEIFGVANVITAFIVAMLLQTFKFILQGIIRPILIGFVQLLSDYLIKPFLTLLYNGFTQPISIFLYNVIASIRDVMQPLAKGVGFFIELIAVVLRAIRLVEVKNVTNITPCGPQPVRY